MFERDMIAKALKVLRVRGFRVGTRVNYYEGRQPSVLGSDAFNDAWRQYVESLVDNQVKKVVDKRAEAVMPESVQARDAGVYEEGLALWVSERFDEQSHNLEKAIRAAKASGEQTAVVVDYASDGSGDVIYYHLDARSFYAEVDRSGRILWLVHFWKDSADPSASPTTHATIYTPETTAHWATRSFAVYPAVDDFRPVVDGDTPNLFGEVMAAIIDEEGSVIDLVKPRQDAYNKTLQLAAIAGEAYAVPLQILLGIDLFDPEKGELTKMSPEANAATTSKQISVPAVIGADGQKIDVLEFAGKGPQVFVEEATQHLLAIYRNGSVPAFMFQIGSTPASGESLEIQYKEWIETQKADIRMYAPFLRRIAELSIRRYLYRLTGAPLEAPRMKVNFVRIDTSTLASRAAAYSQLRAGGMSVRDAAIHALGVTPEEADQMQAIEDARAAAAADRQTALFEQGAVV